MTRKQSNPLIKVELELTSVAAGHLKRYLQDIIPHRITPAHVRHMLFSLHAKLSAAIDSPESDGGQ